MTRVPAVEDQIFDTLQQCEWKVVAQLPNGEVVFQTEPRLARPGDTISYKIPERSDIKVTT